MPPEISIIIPTYNTRPLTLDCLRDVVGNLSQDRLEIIVVDNHSTDGTSEAIKNTFPSVKLISNPQNEGYGRACNQGAAIAQAPYVCFLNNDTLHAGDAVNSLKNFLDQNPETGLVVPKLLRTDGSIQQMSWGWNSVFWGELIQQYLSPDTLRQSRFKTWIVDRLHQRSRPVSVACGACMMMRRPVFQSVQGFDGMFELYFEDYDLSRRIRQAGWSVVFCADAILVHHLGQSTRGFWSLVPLIYRQSQIHYYRKHAPVWSLPLLKIYLSLKWVRLWISTRYANENRARIERFLHLYWHVIWEKEKLKLEGSYFD